MSSLDDGVGYYGVLSLTRSASHQAIYAAYRRMALQTHPDKGGSHDAYIKVREAFEVLSDPQQRADYDSSLRSSSASDGLMSSARAPATTASGSGTGKASNSSGPLALMADTPRREAARIVVSMLDLPETSWSSLIEENGMEVLEKCSLLLRRTRESPNVRGKAANESADAASARGPPIRGLYETKPGRWDVSLSIRRVQFAVFNVVDLDKAHDFQIALVELRRRVEEKIQAGGTERNAFREAVDEAYESDPELRLVLSFRVNIREAKKAINGPFTHRLETALQLRNRVQQLRDMQAGSQDVDREIRDAKAYEKKQRDLQKARQAAMLQEVVSRLDSLRREAKLKQKQQQLVLALPAPPEPAAPASQEPATPPSQPVEPEAEAPKADAWSVPLKGFDKFCRAMSFTKQQKLQLHRKILDDQAVQTAISDAIARHCGSLRGSSTASIQDAPKSELASSTASNSKRRRTLQGGEASSLALVVADPRETGKSSSSSSWASGLVDRVQRRLRLSGQPAARRKWLLELLLEKHEGVYHPGLLTMCELLRVAMASQRTWLASATATKRQFSNFRLADMGLVTAKSKRGRALPGGQLRMLKECLRTRRFAMHVQHLDISTLDMAPISKEEFQYMLGCLPNLVSIVLPSKGWAGNLQLKNFVSIAKSLKVSIGAAADADIILRNVTGSAKSARPAASQSTALVATTPPATTASGDSKFMLHLRSGRKRTRPGRDESAEPEAKSPSKRETARAQADSEALGFRACAAEVRQVLTQPRQPAQRYSAPVLGGGGQAGATASAPPMLIPETPEPESFVVPAIQALRTGLKRRPGAGEAGGGQARFQPSQPVVSRERHSFWWPSQGLPR
mmetsp:Transcript_86687/g.153406  ORF Transcript_86687/g.153406 Transcript_86687/m.153406 type:complete len:856 (+) Transcript_86687:72-2639(+)